MTKDNVIFAGVVFALCAGVLLLLNAAFSVEREVPTVQQAAHQAEVDAGAPESAEGEGEGETAASATTEVVQ